MMKRKVSAIWVVVLALIAIAACAFAAVTYYRCGKQPEPQFPENELLRILDAGSDAEGVVFEVMRIGGGSVNLRLDLRWKTIPARRLPTGRRLSYIKRKTVYGKRSRPHGRLIIPPSSTAFPAAWITSSPMT